MEILIDIVLPIFGTLFIAYLAARTGLFTTKATEGLATFVFTFAVPSLLFDSVSGHPLPDPIEWELLLSFFGTAYLVWIAGMITSRWLFRRDFAHTSLAGMTAAFGNTMLGLPLVLTTFGEAGSIPIFLIIAFHSWQFFALATILLEGSRRQNGALRALPWTIAKSLATNPILVGLVLGLMCNIFAIPVPDPVADITGFLGRAALPCAVFVMGASLAKFRITGAIGEAIAGSLLKLIAFPALTYIAATYIFTMEPLWRDVAVVMASLPVGINVYLFADRYEAGAPAAATSMLLSTFLSFGTIATVLTLLEVR